MAVFIVFLVLAATASGCSYLYYHFWAVGLKADVEWSQKEVTEGAGVKVIETIENRKWLPLSFVNMKFKMDRTLQYQNLENNMTTDYSYRNDCVALMPFQKITRTFEVTPEKRGYYELDELELVSTDVFCKQVLMKIYPLGKGIFVYPKNSTHFAALEPMRRVMGQIATNTFVQEDPFEFRGIRDYVPTDPRSKINWKASARSDGWKVNQFFDTADPYVVILLNIEMESMLFYGKLIEEEIRVVRNYVEFFLKKGIPVKIISNAVDKVSGEPVVLEPGGNLSHLHTILKKLALIDEKKAVVPMVQIVDGVKETGNPFYVMLTINQSPKLQMAFETLTRGAGNLIVFCHPGFEKHADTCHVQVTYVEVDL